MDEEDEDLFMQEEASFSAQPSKLRKGRGYRVAMIEVLQSIKKEVDTDSLDDLKVMCQGLGMDADASTELLSKKSVLDIFYMLLTHCNNDLRLVILILHDIIPKIIHDFQGQEKLQRLSQTIIRENEIFAFSQTSSLHGRNKELQQLMKLMDFEKAADTRVVNVCGMAGIGKSFLVKHFGSRLLNEEGSVVIYVDVSGVEKLHDMHVKILENPHINGSASSNEDVLGTFYDFLSENKDEKFVLILDDLSSLMPNCDIKLTNDVLSWVNDFTKKIRSLKVQLKLVVTSQIRFTILQEKTETKEWLTNKRKMSDYTKDISLGNLTADVAKKFLGSSLQSLSEQDKEDLVKLCDGHPYSLHFMSSMAEAGYTISTEINKITATDVNALNAEIADMMFPKAFERLTERQKLVLFAVALFDRDAQLGALYHILNPKESSQTFYRQIKEEFSNSFWLTFRVCDVKLVKVAAKRKTVANMHHPLILKYIRNQITLHMEGEQHQSFIQLKRRYILYHINELVGIGKECVPNSPNPDFLRITNMRLMQNRANFRLALGLIAKAQDPGFIFFEDTVGQPKLKRCSDIAHLFLCFHQYHDWFEGSLMSMLKDLISRYVSDVNNRVLLQTLNVMMLAIEQDWRSLDGILRRSLKENDPQLIANTSPELSDFCKAIYGYSEGLLYTHAPFYKERKDALLIDKRSLALGNAFRNLNSEHLSTNWSGVRNYFCVRILLITAEATCPPDTRDVAIIQQGFAFCRQARDLMQQAVMLEPVVYAELAAYKAFEGDQYDDIATATRLYEESKTFYQKVFALYDTYKMQRTSAAARHHSDYALLMRSWANLLTEHDPIPDDCRDKALTFLKLAVKHASKAVEIYEIMGSCSKAELLKSLFGTADSLEILQEVTPLTDMVSRVTYQGAALKYYNDVYKLIKNDYRGCNLSANDFTLNRLIQRLPELMQLRSMPRESIDKVQNNLLHVQRAAAKEAQAALNLSGSDKSSSSSDQDSPDEGWVSEAEMFKLDNILAGTVTSFPALPVRPSICTLPQSTKNAEMKVSTTSEEGEPSSSISKRPRV